MFLFFCLLDFVGGEISLRKNHNRFFFHGSRCGNKYLRERIICVK
jgi:hypothetical protein